MQTINNKQKNLKNNTKKLYKKVIKQNIFTI